MKKVMRQRYYCDFCKKGSGSGGHMKKHEARCTLNPARECGMCKLMGEKQPDLTVLTAILPAPETISFTEYSEVDGDTIKALRDAAGNCPACMLAAIRQRGIPVSQAIGFNFAEECKSFWSDFNESQTAESMACIEDDEEAAQELAA